MCGDGHVTLNAAIAYDLSSGFARGNGFARGMKPIEHIKIRDSLAGEACVMLKHPTSIAEPYIRARTRGRKVHYVSVSYPLDKGMEAPAIRDVAVQNV